MDPAQINTTIVDIVNTSCILVQSMLNWDLQSQVRRRRRLQQRVDQSDEDMDIELSQTACALEILLHKLQEIVEPLQGSPVSKCFTTTTNRRRLSQTPVQGLSEMNISMMINRIKGYECTKDMELLQHMKNQEKAQKLKKTSCNRTVQLGRAFLGKKMDPAALEALPPKAVLGQLNPVKLQHVQQQEKAELHALTKELKKLNHSIAQLPQKQGIRLERESYKQRIQEAKHRVQKAQEDVEHLKCKVKAAQSKLAEVQAHLCDTRVETEKWHTLKEKTTVSQPLENAQDSVNDYLKRRLNRILQRTDLFLEREKIIERLSLLQ